MFGKNSRMTPLESRKLLLIAESEFNRALLMKEWQTIAGEGRNFATRVKSFGSLASAAALLVEGVSAFRLAKATTDDLNTSRLHTLLKGVHLASLIWLAFRAKSQ